MAEPENPSRSPHGASAEDDKAPADATFTRLVQKLHADHNFDFREYKAGSLARRIRARMSQVHVATFADYETYLDSHPDEHVGLFNAILINITGFFRDPEAWAALRDDVAPRMIEAAAERKVLRIWSAGCSSGEEPYSIAMLFAEHLGSAARQWDVKIYATDIDEQALTAARQGLYRAEQVKELPPKLLDAYFVREDQMYRFRRDMRRWCIFGRHNLVQDPPLSHLDLIVCRNVLIYFRSELQDKVLPSFHYALRGGGYLFLGKSESLLARSRWFAPVHLKWRIFRRNAVPAADLRAPITKPSGEPVARTTHPARPDPQQTAVRLQRVIDTLHSSVVLIDPSDTVLTWNPAAESLFEIPTDQAIGKKFRDLDVSYRIDGLRARIEEAKAKQQVSRMDDLTFTRRSGEPVHASLTVAPLFDHRQHLAGVLVGAVDATESWQLKDEVRRLAEQQATAMEELQSTNEELETTNEELQSTNEELETTNEELQSTNEELETTVDELQAANTELGGLNAEFERRSNELRSLEAQHRALLDTLGEAVFVLDQSFAVRIWSRGAEQLWGLAAEHAVGRDFFALPIGEASRTLRDALQRVAATGHPETMRDVAVTPAGGEVRHATVSLAPFPSAGTDVKGIVGLTSVEGAPRPS